MPTIHWWMQKLGLGACLARLGHSTHLRALEQVLGYVRLGYIFHQKVRDSDLQKHSVEDLCAHLCGTTGPAGLCGELGVVVK